MSLFEVDGKKNTEVMSSIELMQKANLALADFGRATAGLVPIMQAFGQGINRLSSMMHSAEAFSVLELISGASADEIEEELRHFKGSIFDLEGFYLTVGCFPSELYAPPVQGTYLMIPDWLTENIVWDFIKKSPRLKQGILFLIILAIMMLLEAF